MPWIAFKFPYLPQWATSLAGILPLATLIEFVDVPTRLHVYQLRGGAVPLWNWPITPSGARVLLENDDTARDCLFDQPQRATKLTCVDGRNQNQYPCSAPATTRLWAAHQTVLPTDEVENKSSNMEDEDAREQILRLVVLTRGNKTRDTGGNGYPASASATPPRSAPARANTRRQNTLSNPKATPSIGRELLNLIRKPWRRGARYTAVSAVGWILWLGLVVIGFSGGLYIAGAYLLVMPLTGIFVGFAHGTTARMPVERNVTPYDRLIIAPGSENPHFWFAFRGHSTLVNGLLNISLVRQRLLPHRKWYLHILGLLILSQWGLALGSSATENWDAFFIAIWTTFCTIVSAYAYPADLAARDWLRRDCAVEVRTIKAKLSGRRPMLIALGTINPDKAKDKFDWMNPFLIQDKVRDAMWEAALEYCNGNKTQKETLDRGWWGKYVVEGVDVGKELDRRAKALMKDDSGSK